jgi:hypothetical protein
MPYENAGQVVNRCKKLADLWARRNANIADWYSLLSMYDELEQKNMESVVANSPRTFYNTALHLLTPSIPHRIPIQGLDREAMAWTGSLERVINRTWSGLDRQYRRRGRKSWMEYTVGLLLITGWYSILNMAARDKLLAEAWNPVEVYPEWDDQDLYAVAHIFTVSNSRARRLFEQRGWDQALFKSKRGGDITIYDLWEMEGANVTNITVAETEIVKVNQEEPFDHIPILVGPAGGLPDDGPIDKLRVVKTREDWRANIGQSILATNANVYKGHNRLMTFMQQILRDTAQPKFWERKKGGNQRILTPETLEKRGAIFDMAEGDEIGTIQMPGIPVELTGLIASYEAMIQKGGLPNALSGDVGNVPIGLMSQVAAAAVQALSLYHRTTMGILTDIDNTWKDGILSGVYQQEVMEIPQNISLDTINFDTKYSINIPGDLTQRATILRMISPSARLAASTGLDLFFPEVQDPPQELARARVDDAQMHPVFSLLNLISALREEAALLRKGGNETDAVLLDRAGQAIQAQLEAMSQPQQAQNGNGRDAGRIPAEGVSPTEQQQLRDLGVDPNA